MEPTTRTTRQAPSHLSAIRAIPANENGRGNLAGFGARCADCAWTATSTIRVNLELDAQGHARWAAAR